MLTFDDFATLGTHLYTISQLTYTRMVHFIDQVRKLR
jgi:hypothetical protein